MPQFLSLEFIDIYDTVVKMRGLSFQNGIEYKVNIEGESWAQGDSISIRLESKTPSSLTLILAEGVDKKVKLKSADAFTILEKFSSDTSPLDQVIQLPLNSPISDKSGSLYVLYGKGDESPEKLGQLRLNIIPHLHLRDLIEVMTSHFRFAQKTTSATKKNEVEVKLDPPGSKEWTSLELLTLKLLVTEETIEAHFQFNRSEIDPMKGRLAKVMVKREMERSWPLSELIHNFNQRLNKEKAIQFIDQVVEEYKNLPSLA